MRILQAALFAGMLFLGMVLSLSIGWRLGRARLRVRGEDAIAGLGALEGSVYALMGLLIAFTFTGATERFEHRRDLIVEEANALGTAWLRLDLLDDPARADVQALFKQYLDARIATYANIGDSDALAAAIVRSMELQEEIWHRAATAAKQDPTPRVAASVLPPLNEMFDIANTRAWATRQHPPLAIYLMLGALVFASGLLAGFGMAKAESLSTAHVIGYAAIVSIAVYLILDLEFPRLGLLRVDDFDAAFVELRRTME